MSAPSLLEGAKPAALPAGASVSRTPFRRTVLGAGLWALRREFAWCGVFSFFANLLVLTSTLYMLQIYDRVMLSGSLLTLLAITLIAVFFYGVMGFADWIRSRLMVRVSAKLDDVMSSQVFRAAFEAALKRPGKSPVQSFNDLTTLRQFVTGNGVFAFFDMPWAPIYLVVLFIMNPWLGWTGVAFTLLMVVVAIVTHRVTAPAIKAAGEAAADTNAYLQSKLRNAETVEALGMQGHLRTHWLALHERMLDRQEVASVRARRLQSVARFVQNSQQSLILTVGAILALAGQIGVGAMIASNALLGNALRPLTTLVATWKLAVDAMQAFRRLEGLLSENPERRADQDLPAVRGQISLRNLVATAPGRQVPILDGLQIDFKAGEVVGIVGPSGAGKSTLAKCLVGIWPGVQGQVVLDGVPIDRWSRTELGPHLGYLPQDIEMLDGTIAENIARFAKVDPEKVIAAATHTGIHDMILRLPKGYDTPMGEAGGLLSGGQRQRIGLARAIYGDPAVLVLDEPNANLDDLGEAALLRTVRSLREQGKTVFMIVHQKNLLAAADRVLTLAAGTVKQFDTLQAVAAAPTIESQA